MWLLRNSKIRSTEASIVSMECRLLQNDNETMARPYGQWHSHNDHHCCQQLLSNGMNLRGLLRNCSTLVDPWLIPEHAVHYRALPILSIWFHTTDSDKNNFNGNSLSLSPPRRWNGTRWKECSITAYTVFLTDSIILVWPWKPAIDGNKVTYMYCEWREHLTTRSQLLS